MTETAEPRPFRIAVACLDASPSTTRLVEMNLWQWGDLDIPTGIIRCFTQLVVLIAWLKTFTSYIIYEIKCHQKIEQSELHKDKYLSKGMIPRSVADCKPQRPTADLVLNVITFSLQIIGILVYLHTLYGSGRQTLGPYGPQHDFHKFKSRGL